VAPSLLTGLRAQERLDHHLVRRYQGVLLCDGEMPLSNFTTSAVTLGSKVAGPGWVAGVG